MGITPSDLLREMPKGFVIREIPREILGDLALDILRALVYFIHSVSLRYL
jgi:hypothetical protein